MNNKILSWFINGRVGASSSAMAAIIAGVESDNVNHPYDPSDLGRCIEFLDAVPEAREHLDKVRSLSIEWDMLIDSWSKLEKTYRTEEEAYWNYDKVSGATYRLIGGILKQAKDKKLKDSV